MSSTNNQQEMIDALLQALASSQKTVAELRNEISLVGGKRRAATDEDVPATLDAAEVPSGKTKKSKKDQQPKKEPKAPKAATPYNLYVKEQSTMVRAPPGEMMKVIAQQWNALDADGKQAYVDAAKVAKEAMNVSV
jgi:hypothetical protein